MSSHEVRKLVICSGCYDLGNRERMVPGRDGWWHGRCYAVEFGEELLVKLPPAYTSVLALDDIGPDRMRRILDAQFPRREL